MAERLALEMSANDIVVLSTTFPYFRFQIIVFDIEARCGVAWSGFLKGESVYYPQPQAQWS